ncbi:MAG TPA: PDZ domain-containing protein [Verrucomicrobiae bacterium]
MSHSGSRSKRWLASLSGILVFFLIGFAWSTYRAQTRNTPPSTFQQQAQQLLNDPIHFATNKFKGGIGAALSIDPTTSIVRVSHVIDESPAQAAGLQIDDVILEVNGQPTQGKQLIQVVDMIRGWTIADVHLLVSRSGTNLTCEVSRASWTKLKQLGNLQ